MNIPNIDREYTPKESEKLANEKDCWNCEVAEEMREEGILGKRPCVYAEQLMRNPCRGWKPLEKVWVNE